MTTRESFLVATLVELAIALVCLALAGHILIQLVTGNRNAGRRRQD